MTVQVCDISTFENSQALIRHYADVRRRFRQNKHNRGETEVYKPDKAVSLPHNDIVVQCKPDETLSLQHNDIVVRNTPSKRPKAKSRQKKFSFTRPERKILFSKLLKELIKTHGFKADVFSQTDLPIEGVLLLGAFIETVCSTHKIEYSLIADILSVGRVYISNTRQFYHDYLVRRSDYDVRKTIKNETSILSKIAYEVAHKHAAKIADIRGSGAKKHLMLARQEFMFRALNESRQSKTVIADFINRDHRSCLAIGHAAHAQRLAAMK